MTEAQIQLQNALTTTFLANLAFLSEFDNKLYHRVDELSRMIENNTYKEKYHLEFIMEDGDFDIYDVVNDKYLYNKKPKKFNSDLVREVEFDNKNSILNLGSHFLIKDKYKITKDRFECESKLDFLRLTLADIQEYTDITKEYFDNQNKRSLKKIDKFIFLGTLLGRHIPKIAKKVNAKAYLILEKNLEIFRLSLFTVDYTVLARNGAIFSVMEDSKTQNESIFDFLCVEKIYNYLIKISSTNVNISSYIDMILTNLSLLEPTAYDYNRRLYSSLNRTTQELGNQYKIILFNKLRRNCNYFKDKPILYIAAGPSLDENLEWIKENQSKFFIVTIGATYKKLIENSIRIDIITTLDESDIIVDLQFDDKSISKISNNTIILASTISNSKILERLSTKNLYIYEVFYAIHKDNIALAGFSIGELTLNLLLYLNPKEIYMIGLDLALNQKTGSSHTLNSNSKTIQLNLEEKQNRDSFDSVNSLIKVKGNLKKEVFTTPFFYSSIEYINNTVIKEKKYTKIYNLSTNGAFLDKTISRKISNIKIDAFENLSINFHELLEVFDNNSSTKLSNSSIKIFKKDIEFVKKDIENELEKIRIKEYKSYNDFIKDITKVIVISFKTPILYQFITFYGETIIPYLLYFFNNKKLKNEARTLKKLKEIYMKQTERLIKDYIFCIERIT